MHVDVGSSTVVDAARLGQARERISLSILKEKSLALITK